MVKNDMCGMFMLEFFGHAVQTLLRLQTPEMHRRVVGARSGCNRCGSARNGEEVPS